ncbi:hypothetical protein ACHJH3_08625 [Campylobacter sp. MOP7]|uniref:hypothetical protein n=1 Tax=Campylobacter canis TaxID=3378588 RepID=UPI00387E571B
MQNLSQNINRNNNSILLFGGYSALLFASFALSQPEGFDLKDKQNCFFENSNYAYKIPLSTTANIVSIDRQLYNSILAFCETIIRDSQDIDHDISKIINDEIMSLLA